MCSLSTLLSRMPPGFSESPPSRYGSGSGRDLSHIHDSTDREIVALIWPLCESLRIPRMNWEGSQVPDASLLMQLLQYWSL